ncbi:MAG TPA: DUF86 domain-containing protein [Pirellulales bacterium]|nr:DUF86 domain-containing protein [Pirellulales bacterium]
MSRDYKVFLQDVLEAIDNVAEFVGPMTWDQFQADKKTLHAVVRNLEVIGEAVKQVPAETRHRHPQIPWQRIAGLRDILIHNYFGIDLEIVWDIVRNKLPELKRQIDAVLCEEEST